MLLEPIMDVEVRVPEAYMGDVNRDLNTRRGRVLGMDTEDGLQMVRAQVPQSELFTYATELRSLTGGRGTFSATLDHYEEVPAHVAPEGHRGPPQGARGGRRPLTGMSEVYTWEPSDAALAARYGLSVDRIVRFDTNTSPVPPAFVPSVLQAGPWPLNEYPDSAYQAFTEAAAAYAGAGVQPDEIIVGAGADEILDLIGKAFLPAGGAAVVPGPSYGLYPVITSQRAARRIDVPRSVGPGGWAMDVDGVVRALAGAQVVWLCEPNNPTGSSDGPEAVGRILEAAGALAEPPAIVVDEAYFEFTGRTVIPWRARYPHLIVVRTLSKAFALPGIRVGWAVAARPTIARLERVRPAGSISTISAALAAVALARPDEARARAAALAAEREWLAPRLAAGGWAPYPSVTNFLLVHLGSAADAAEAAEHLLRHGLVPRTFAPDGPLGGHLRLTVRSREENERLLAAVASA